MDEELRLKQVFDEYGVSDEHRESITRYLQIVRNRDEATYLHSIRVGILAAQIAKYSDNAEVNPKALLWAGLLHDIGKALVNPELFRKDEAFTEKDYEEMEPHAEYGWRLLRDVHEYTANIIVRHHTFGKRPYPKKLPLLPARLESQRSVIEFSARLLALADYYDALMVRDDSKSGRALSPAMKREKYLKDNSDQNNLILILEQKGVLKFLA